MLAWFARLAGRAEGKRSSSAYPVIDAKTVIYAVGDIHGRADLLGRVGRTAESLVAYRPAERRLEIYLGDYVDRGPDSAAVIAMLRARADQRKIMALSGNHEAMLLRFLDGRISDREWLDWGGAATALSYGVNPSREAILSAALSRAVPLEHVRFLRALRPSFRYGPYFFAHAGVLPNRALEDQVPDTQALPRPYGALRGRCRARAHAECGSRIQAEPDQPRHWRLCHTSSELPAHRFGRRGADRRVTAPMDGT